MSLQHLILLRHGETDWNARLRMQGHRDIPLNETGRQQAKAAAPSVAALQPDVLVASDLQRARQTAEPVAELTSLPVRTDPRLRETSLGQWEGLTREEVVAGWPGHWEQWRLGGADHAPPGGESRAQVAERAMGVVADLDGGTAHRGLLVAHGGLIVGLTGRLLGLSSRQWSLLTGVSNCHWVVVHRSATHTDSVAGTVDGGWRLHSYNAGLTDVVLPGEQDEVAGV